MFFGNTKINNLTKHISINFTRSATKGGIIEPNELAGAIPAKNWNNITTDICNNFSTRATGRDFFGGPHMHSTKKSPSLQNPEYITYYIHNGEYLYQDRRQHELWGTQTHTIFTTSDYFYTSNIGANDTDLIYGPEQVFHFQSRNGGISTFNIEIRYNRFAVSYIIYEYISNTNTTKDIQVATTFRNGLAGMLAKNFLVRLKIDFTTTTPTITISRLIFQTGTGSDIILVDNLYTDWDHKVFQPTELEGYENWRINKFYSIGGNLNMKFDYMVSTVPLDNTNLTGNITQNLISGIKPLKDSKGKLLVNTKLIQTPSSKITLNENYSKDYDRNDHDNYIKNGNSKSIEDYYSSNIILFKGYTECYYRIDIIDIPEDFRNSTYDVRIYTSFDSDHYSNNGDPFYELKGWNDNELNPLYNRSVCVGSVDNSFVYPVINNYKPYNNSGAIVNIVSPYIWDLTTGAMSDNDPYVKTSISNSGFVGTELGWAAVSHYSDGGTAYYSNNNYAIFKGLSVTNISITSIDSNFNKIGGIQITKNN